MARTRSLATLDDLHVRAPCTASWEAMSGDDRVRHCATCGRDVHDLSAGTREEAEALLARRHEAPLCVRFARRDDGSILTRSSARRVASAGLVAVALAVTPACSAPPSGDAPNPVAPAPSASASASASAPSKHTLGCVCLPGDPLCSCL